MQIESSEAKELLFDGVRYMRLQHAGKMWRLGSCTAAYTAELLHLGMNPGEEALAALSRRGIFLAPEKKETEPLALMCQGMGALWPGCGRELYEEFPVAREAMDRIASIASWDVLGLLDETDQNVINATRWQIPYLFLLEYAQWSCLTALGLRPTLVCGHSLGELIALCCSGIYSPEVAWHILDTRAEHVASLEARAERNFGMLAVHAGSEVVASVLEASPEVRVANYNTPTQFILGGPKDVLKEIRSHLRKKRIPAVSISVSLLFHHPQMRILREHSVMRLNALDMHPPKIPVMSVSKCVPYPLDEPSICSFIVDLDENPVRFSECLSSMWNEHGIRSFLEIGPQEVLCGLISENLPEAQVMSAGRKGREALGLRELCAQLYALGFLEEKAIVGTRERCALFLQPSEPVMVPEAEKTKAQTSEVPFEDMPGELTALLSRLSGIPASEITPYLDLRHDLALRSSSFPLLLTEAEGLFGSVPSFEELVRVTTVGDLVRVFRGEHLSENRSLRASPLARIRPLVCLAWQKGEYRPVSWACRDVTSERCPSLGLLPGQEDAQFLSFLLPDLLLGLPGLVEEIRVPMSLAPYLEDTGGCRLPLHFVDQKTILASEVVLLLDCAHETSEIRAQLQEEKISSLIHLCLFDGLEQFSTRRAPEFGLRRIDYVPGTLRRRFLELSNILPQALTTDYAHLVWTTAEEAKKLLAETSEKYFDPPLSAPALENTIGTQLVPLRQAIEQVRSGSISACAYFSSDLDPALRTYSHLPFASALEVFGRCALAHAPWLTVTAFSDLTFGDVPELLPSVVREGVLETKSCGWITLQHVQTRQIKGTLSVRTLKGGRTDGSTTPLITGCVVLAEEDLPHTDFQWGPNDELFSAKLVLPIPKECSAMREIYHITATDLVARLTPPPESGCIAHLPEKEYISTVSLLEGCMQAAFLHLTRHESCMDGHHFRPAQAGLITLRSIPPSVTPMLFLHRTWNDAKLTRFDACVRDGQGRTLLTISQLEFEQAPDIRKS